jgi:diguanylate cyclase (GGDEF)-like protein
MKSHLIISRQTRAEQNTLRRIQRGLLLGMAALIITITSLSWHYYQKDKQVFIHSTESISPSKLDVILEELAHLVSDVIQDTLFIAKMHKDYLENSPSQAMLQTKRLLENISAIKPVYDQLRILSPSGMEKIRINQTQEGPYAVPPSQLQDKRHRYYYQEALEVPKGHIYISPIDLNIEHGQIERPYKPMMRFATPVYDHNNQITSVVIVNYLARELINVLSKYSQGNVQLMLLNQAGYWIKAPRPDLEWGFMFPERKDTKFSKSFPDVWKVISSQKSGRLEHPEGIFNFETIDFDSIKRANDKLNQTFSLSAFTPEFNNWKLVTYLPKTTLDEAIGSMQVRYALIAGLLIILSSISLFLLYQNTLNRYKQRQALLSQAYFDQLTGAYNRTSLDNITQETFKHDKDAAFIFIDLDGFKPINDQYGHQTGDEVLKIIVKRVQHLLRANDVLFRLGGDEFAILLSGQMNRADIEHIVRRIEEVIEKPMQIKQNRIEVRASVGYSCYGEDGHDADSLLNAADEKMYAVKHARKQPKQTD